MILEKMYTSFENDLKKSLNQKNIFQELLYYIRKDNNIKETENLMKEFSERDIRNEADRVKIILSGFSDNIIYLEKFIGLLIGYTYHRNSFLKDYSIEQIAKCCNVFPDHIGENFVRFIAIYPLIVSFKKLLELYSNNSLKEENTEIFETLYEDIVFLSSFIFKNEKSRLDLGIKILEEKREKNKGKDSEILKGLKSLINNLSEDYNESKKVYNIEEIKIEISKIEYLPHLKIDMENLLKDEILLVEILSSKHTKILLKSLVEYSKKNDFLYLYLDKITLIILKNKKENEI